MKKVFSIFLIISILILISIYSAFMIFGMDEYKIPDSNRKFDIIPNSLIALESKNEVILNILLKKESINYRINLLINNLETLDCGYYYDNENNLTIKDFTLMSSNPLPTYKIEYSLGNACFQDYMNKSKIKNVYLYNNIEVPFLNLEEIDNYILNKMTINDLSDDIIYSSKEYKIAKCKNDKIYIADSSVKNLKKVCE